jgi:hypothetical protein
MDLLFRHKWFCRVWTLQEPSPDPVVCASAVNLPWAVFEQWTLLRIEKSLDRDGRPTASKLARMTAILNAQTCQNIYHQSTKIRHSAWLLTSANPQDIHQILSKKYMRALDLLELSRVRRSKDPRDSIYSLYQVFLDMGLVLPEPNYNQTTPLIFEAVPWPLSNKPEVYACCNSWWMPVRDATSSPSLSPRLYLSPNRNLRKIIIDDQHTPQTGSMRTLDIFVLS